MLRAGLFLALAGVACVAAAPAAAQSAYGNGVYERSSDSYSGSTRTRKYSYCMGSAAACAARMETRPAVQQTYQAPTHQEIPVTARCSAEAEALATSGGAKSGYARSYRAAYDACVDRYNGGGGVDYSAYRQPRNRAPVRGNCPAGAGPLYGGTLYCVD